MQMQAKRGGEAIAPTYSLHGFGRRWVVSNTPRPLHLRKKYGTCCTENWLGLGADLRGKDNCVPAGIRSSELQVGP